MARTLFWSFVMLLLAAGIAVGAFKYEKSARANVRFAEYAQRAEALQEALNKLDADIAVRLPDALFRQDLATALAHQRTLDDYVLRTGEKRSSAATLGQSARLFAVFADVSARDDGTLLQQADEALIQGKKEYNRGD
jgi:hypothetical protein